ncbi:MAG: neutral zinc metallopeptidase [Pseudolabrys sp.]|nr:neutral zinc metallopeptidase [Pseudolabrys sp.]MDP2295818.1 neutral zinc metallopeptidase [Pseudolabrys sp.]
MRWDDFRRSDNVEDDRGGGGGGGFGGGGLPIGGGGLGIGTVVVLGIIGWALGIDPSVLISGAEMVNSTRTQQQQPYQQPAGRTSKPSDQMGDFVAAVLGNTEDTWIKVFQDGGQTYRPPRLRLFSGQVQGACGAATASSGPFYCPTDKRIYLDTSFFNEMRTRFKGCTGKACEFAEAYVVAHEVGHHVQNLLGILPKARQAQQAAGNKTAANRIQVQVELQADCFAGIWANQSNQRWKSIEPGDVEAALQTAAAIGDDRLQKMSRGYVVPDSFTHGSSAQRQRWFTIGLKDGKVSACNTFAAGAQL